MKESTVYIVVSEDPYDERDRPYVETAFSDKDDAEADCVRRFESTFGKGSWETWAPTVGSYPKPSDYYHVEARTLHAR